MANTLDQFTEATSISDTDLLHVKTGIGTNTDKKISIANVKTALKTGYIGQNLQTGITYTLVLSDAGKVIEMNNLSANTLTIPANASVAFPVDTRIDIVQGGAGLTTVAITSDTLNGDTVSVGTYKALSLWKKSATVWYVFGGTTA